MPNSTRRQFLTTAVAAAAPVKDQPPNVLFLMSDEHSPHAAHWMGNKIVQTPALDTLAAEGVSFTSAYCQNPICVPSRASFVTGRMPSNVGVFGNGGGLQEDAVTLADVFQKAGYTTAWFGKTHWGGNPRFNLMPGTDAGARVGHEVGRSRLPQDAFLTKEPVSNEVDTLAQQQTLAFLREYKDKPFFAGASFIKPHFPFIVQQEYFQRYSGSIDAPRVTPKMIEDLPEMSRQEREKYGFAALTTDQIRRARAIYFGMVTFIDELIGGILKQVDQLGLRRNTIIIYTSDHGELAGEHGLWYKNSFYDAAARIPHIWSIPGRAKGKIVSAPTMNMDIFPTLCDLCGLEKPAALEGSSLLPLIDGKNDGKERYALSENFRAGWAGRMIRTGKWKYCYYHKDREQLFDLEADPAEAVNLIARPEHRELAAELKRRALANWKMEPSKRGRKG